MICERKNTHDCTQFVSVRTNVAKLPRIPAHCVNLALYTSFSLSDNKRPPAEQTAAEPAAPEAEAGAKEGEAVKANGEPSSPLPGVDIHGKTSELKVFAQPHRHMLPYKR